MFWKWSLMSQGSLSSYVIPPTPCFSDRLSGICSWPSGPCVTCGSISLSLSHHCCCSLPCVVIGCVSSLCSTFPLPLPPSGLWMQTRKGLGCSMCPAGIMGWGKREAIPNQAGAFSGWLSGVFLPTSNPGNKYIMWAWRLQSLEGLPSTIT